MWKNKLLTLPVLAILIAVAVGLSNDNATESKSLSSGLADQDVVKIQKKINTFKVDSQKCNDQYKAGVGFGYRYKRKVKDLITDKSVDNKFIKEDASGATNYRILENGLASLWARIDLIRKAEKKIDLEYFIYRIRENKRTSAVTSVKSFLNGEKDSYINRSTIILTKELLKKALAGVKVRVLIDASGTVWTFKEDMYASAQLMLKKMADENEIDYNKIKHNFQFKIYNKRAIVRISSLNFRNHRKLLLVDDKYAITGGRNIEDKYFDLDPYYNFHDRDVLITYEPGGNVAEGGLIESMSNSFESFWNKKKIAKLLKYSPTFNYNYYVDGLFKSNSYEQLISYINSPETLVIANGDESYRNNIKKILKNIKKAYDIFSINTEYVESLVNENGKHNYGLTRKQNCKKATFVTDKPIPKNIFSLRLRSLFRDTTYKEEYRYTGRVLEEKLFQALNSNNKNIIVSSPYLSLNCRTNKIAQESIKKGAKFSIFTNSLASTDAIYNASLFYKRADKFISSGADLYAHSSLGFSNGENKFSFLNKGKEKINARDVKWGLHSKSHVYGDDTIYIGTYNMDNRSSFYNTEMGVLCEGSKGLADELKENISKRLQNTSIKIESVSNEQSQFMLDQKEYSPYGLVSEGEVSFMYKIFPVIKKLEFLF